MRFAGIELPPELVSAHAANDVVFFVGAGASIPRPTGLPRFTDLTCAVARLAGSDPPSDAELKEPDVFLGRLDADARIDVHRLVEQLIRAKRKRNALHNALAVLAAAPGAPRLVTTNYDDHLHRALKGLGVAHNVFEAPALPDGSDFEGLVHLHGRLGQRPDRLVVTDVDFGSAYITRGWAPAFLRDVFARFIVCFIGYSHDDRMMDYLAKGLPSNARPRYIVTDIADHGRWERLRITPILYANGKHETVIDLLERWGAWARDTPYDRAGRIRLLAGAAPPVDPDDHDFLVASLEDATLAHEVCKIARGSEWVDWMVQQAPFRAVLGDADATTSADARREVAFWIAEQASANDQFETLYKAVSASSGPLDPLLAPLLLRGVGADGTDASVRSTWLRWALAAPDIGSSGRTQLEVLWASHVDLSWDDTMLLLDHMANRWSPERRTPFGLAEAPGVHLALGLSAGIHRINPAPDTAALRELLNWVTNYLEQAHRRMTFRGRSYDGWSFGRSSIAPQAENVFRGNEIESVVIDLARDSLANAHLRAEELAVNVRISWLSSRTPLLRRLALYDFATSGADVDSQLAILLDYDVLLSPDLRPETYEVLAAVAPKLNDDQYTALVDHVAQAPAPPAFDGSGTPDVERGDRIVYDILQWLANHRPDADPPLPLADLQGRHPEWRVDDRPQFRHRATVGSSSIEDEWPWQPDQFHAMVLSDPLDALEQLRMYPAEPSSFGWWGGGNMLIRTVEGWPEDGFTLWPLCTTEERSCVLSGWATTPLAEDQLEHVMRTLADIQLAGLDREVARLLRPWTNDPAIANRWLRRADARALARRLRTSLTVTGTRVGGVDLYTGAINSTPGTLAEFWVAAAVEDARKGTFPGGGLAREVALALEELLEPSDYLNYVQAPLLLRASFFLRADPAWTRQHLLPLINPRQRPWAEIEELWSVVLSGQFSDELLEEGVLDWIPEIARYVQPDSADAGAVARVAALIAVQSTIDDKTRRSWLTRFVANASLKVTLHWTTEVAEFASRLAPEARTSLWRRWMLPYLTQRANGSPRVLSGEETTALLSWLATQVQSKSIREGAEALIRAGTGLSSANDWYGPDVPDDALRTAPDVWAQLLASLLVHTEALNYGLDHWLDNAIQVLAGAGAPASSLEAIRGQRFRLGRTE